MLVTFFKTVFLVMVLGVLHGLVFLPVVLVLFVRNTCAAQQNSPTVCHDAGVVRVRAHTQSVITRLQPHLTRSKKRKLSERPIEHLPVPAVPNGIVGMVELVGC
jgi:hypothetical protein